MPVFGERFVYGNKLHTEGEVRVARTRAEFALWGRQQARRFAEAKKRPKRASGDKEADVVTQPCAPEQQEEVRRSLYIPAGFLAHLLSQEEFFLHYLRGHYGVSIFVGTSNSRKVHIKGPKPSVVACYECMKELLKRWHQRQAGDQ